jgi:hypothetical protein
VSVEEKPQVPTGAQRSGGTCGLFPVRTQTLSLLKIISTVATGRMVYQVYIRH